MKNECSLSRYLPRICGRRCHYDERHGGATLELLTSMRVGIKKARRTGLRPQMTMVDAAKIGMLFDKSQVLSFLFIKTYIDMENTFLIPASVADHLPSTVKSQLQKMGPDQQSQFLEEFRRKAKSPGMGLLALFLLGWHYAYLGKWGRQILLWASAFALIGVVWWIIDLFRVTDMVHDYNKDIATDVMRDMKILGA